MAQDASGRERAVTRAIFVHSTRDQGFTESKLMAKTVSLGVARDELHKLAV